MNMAAKTPRPRLTRSRNANATGSSVILPLWDNTQIRQLNRKIAIGVAQSHAGVA
jgi:hypothetical protein